MTNDVACALVLRISEDPNDLRHGTTRQRTLGRTLAERLEWPIRDEYEDNNRSAWKFDVLREEYERLLADIKSGRINAIIAYDQDRIARRTEGWAAFRRLCKKHGVRLAFVTEGMESNFRSASGGAATGIKAVVSEYESEIKSERLQDASDDRARQGKVSAFVHYGWKRVVEYNDRGVKISWHDEINPETAPIVVEIAERLVDGQSLNQIRRSLDERGIPTPSAGRPRAAVKWNNITLRSLVLRPANVGLRLHRGEILEGVVAEAPPLMDMDLYEKVTTLLNDPTRRKITDNRVKNLLTMIVRCGVCGAPCRVKSDGQGHGRGKRNWCGYTCSEKYCVGSRQSTVDEWVTTATLGYLTRLDAADLLPDTDSDVTAAAAEVVKLQARLDERLDMFNAGELTRAEFVKAKATILPQLEAAQAAAKIHLDPGIDLAYRLSSASDIELAWEALSLSQKRAVLSTLWDIRIMKSPSRRDPSNPRVVMKRKGLDDDEPIRSFEVVP